MKRQRFQPNPHGPLAFHQEGGKAIGVGDFYEEPALDPQPPAGGIAVIRVRGPLEAHAGWFFDSYSDVRARIEAALAVSPKAIVMHVSSPGGVVATCFETARRIRAMCEEAGVELVGYVDDLAASGGYALLSAASRIVVTGTATLGSIGVVQTRVSLVKADEMMGVQYDHIASGDRKLDMNAGTSLTPDGDAAIRRRVMSQAALFFALVEDMRGIPAEQVAAMQADLFTGAEAVALGLADEVGDLDSLLASLASGSIPEPEDSNMDMEKILAALKAKAEGDDEEEAAKAKAAIKAMEGDDEEDDSESKSKAEGGEPPKKDDEGEATASTGAKAVALQALAKVHAMEAQMAAKAEADERARLIASRQDLEPEMVALLEDPETPIAMVRKTVETLPKKPRVHPAVGITQPNATQPSGAARPQINAEDQAALDRAFGRSRKGTGITHTPTRSTFGFMHPDEARAELRRRQEANQ